MEVLQGMAMELDLSEILNEWEFDPDNYMRVLKLADGREVLQVRQPLGIEQYELDGRPDGKHPFNKGSVLEEFLDRLNYHQFLFKTDETYSLSHDDFLLLHDEEMLYYARYLLLYQMGDFERTSRDTAHNLKICDIIERYLADEHEKAELLQYRPYIIRMNAIARAYLLLEKGMGEQARDTLRNAIEAIQSMPEIETPTFKLEKERSLDSLRSRLIEITGDELSEVEQLSLELEQAVSLEDYEKAAELRDKINSIRGS